MGGDRGIPRARWTIGIGGAALVAAALFVTAAAPGRAGEEARGVVSGVVVLDGRASFEGTPPDPVPIDMSADPYCERANPEPSLERPVAVGEDGGLADVIVSVKEGAPAESGPPEREVVLDQRGCRYRPHVFTLQAGQTLVIRNSDGTLHNVHAHTRINRGFNIGQPIEGMESRRAFALPEHAIAIRCDIHGWMESFVSVFDHPFHTVSSSSGAFALPALPPGEYLIEAWHETLGSLTRTVSVRPGEETRIEFRFPD